MLSRSLDRLGVVVMCVIVTVTVVVAVIVMVVALIVIVVAAMVTVAPGRMSLVIVALTVRGPLFVVLFASRGLSVGRVTSRGIDARRRREAAAQPEEDRFRRYRGKHASVH